MIAANDDGLRKKDGWVDVKISFIVLRGNFIKFVLEKGTKIIYFIPQKRIKCGKNYSKGSSKKIVSFLSA